MKRLIIVLLVIFLTSCSSKSVDDINKEYEKSTDGVKVTENISAYDKAKKESEKFNSSKESEVINKGSINSNVDKKEDKKNSYIVCIDPGHQRKQITKKEPIAKGSSEMKIGVAQGATGVSTKKPEYELNLEVSMIIKKMLQEKGYTVVMTRESHDVSLTNIQRAEIGNSSNANLVVRVHADSNDSPSVSGYSILYPSGKYTNSIQAESMEAAKDIEKAIKTSTNSKSRGLIPRDDMTGFNWSKVPSVIVEMGFLSNPNEDMLMSEKSYQEKMATGIVNGIEAYFRN